MARWAISPGNFALIHLATCLFVLSALSCSDTSAPAFRQYYLNEIGIHGAGQVYRYVPLQNDNHPIEDWHHRLYGDFRNSFITSALLDADGAILQRSIVHLGRDHAAMSSLELIFSSDSTVKSTEATIHAGTLFPFSSVHKPHAPIRFQAEYWDTTEDSVRVILTKERSFIRKLEFTFDGKDIPAVEFSVNETLETETEGFTETQWTGTEIYGRNIGLLYYRKPINENLTLEYALESVTPYDEYQIEMRSKTH